MRIIASGEIDACLEDRAVLETLRHAYRSNTIAPRTSPIPIDRPGHLTGTLSLQPAWTDFAAQGDVSRGYVGCALSLDLPEQPGLTSSLYLLFSGSGGQPVALLDGMRLNAWRTSALHALAAGYLSREDTSRLLVIGDDPRLPRLVSAYAEVRNLSSVLLAGTSQGTRSRIGGLAALRDVHVGETGDIPTALDGADMVCIAGLDHQAGHMDALAALDPPAGCHIDVLDPSAPLPELLLQEARLFTSDLAAPPLTGLEWAADLKELTRGSKAGRRYYGQRTLFLPGPGTGLADHALAAHIFLKT